MPDMERDMSEQPGRIAGQWRSLAEGELAGARRKARGLLDEGWTLLTGMGASLRAAEYGAALLRERGRQAIAVSADQLLAYPKEGLEDAALVAISQSGESVEVVALLEQERRFRALVGVTNQPDSTLGRKADVVFPLGCSEEAGTATKTFTATLITLYALAAEAEDADAEPLAQAVEKAVQAAPPAEWVEALADGAFLDLVGLGLSEIIARYGALALRETAHVLTAPFGLDEYRHGVIETARDGYRLLALGAGEGRMKQTAEEVAGYGGQVLAVPWPGEEFGDLGPHWNVFVYAACLQRLAVEVARRKGIEPGRLRMGKVVSSWE